MSTLAGGDFDRARAVLLEAQTALRAHQETVAHSEAFVEMMLSRVEQSRGDDRRAQLHAEEAVRQARVAQVPHRLTQALNVLAASLRFDDLTAAQRAVEEAEAAARADVRSGLGLGNAMMTRAELSDLRGEPTEALRELRAAVVAWEDSVPTSVLVSSCARSCRIFAHAGAPLPAAVVGGVAAMGAYSHLLSASVDRRGGEMLQTTLDELRQQLGDDVYDRESARGAAMSVEETLRFIREAADHMLADPFSD
jgi:hypothetical protein